VLFLLFLSLEVLFMLRVSSVVELLFDELLELDELLVDDELLDSCVFLYSSKSFLRFSSHSEFSDAPLFLNLQTFRVNWPSSKPKPTANCGEQPLPFAGGFKIWQGLPLLNFCFTSWHSLVLVKPAFLPHLHLPLKSSPSDFPSNPTRKLSPSQLFSSALNPFLNEHSLLLSPCEAEDDEEDEEDEEVAFWDPLCSLDEQKARKVNFLASKDEELEALDALSLDDEPPEPLADLLELLLDDELDELELDSSLTMKPAIPFPPAQLNLQSPGLL